MNNEEKLIKMLKYVSEHNDFYKNRIKEYGITNPLDITQWPILTRKELQNNRHSIFSDGYRTQYLCHQLLLTASSGTTGHPIGVYWDHRDYYNSMMSLWRKRKAWYSISPSDKRIMFTLSHTNKVNRLDEVLSLETSNRLMFNAASLTSENAYNAVIKYILDFQPKWIYIQPFILEQLIYYFKKSGVKCPNSLKHIESVGEVLNDELRNKVQDFFGISIVNLYGSEEHGGIAYECPNGAMHVLDENVYVEAGALITNINNHAFPLIRTAFLSASKFSKIVINMQSFLQIIYHSITTEVVSVDIQSLQVMIQDVFLYHSSITPKTWYFYHITENQPIDIFFLSKSI